MQALPPGDGRFIQDSYRIAGCIPSEFGQDKHITSILFDKHISSILLSSSSSINLISQRVVDAAWLVAYSCEKVSLSGPRTIEVNKYTTFDLYIAGVKASITAFIDPNMSDSEVMVLGMPAWEAYVMSLDRTAFPEREIVATIAVRTRNQPDPRVIVPKVEEGVVREVLVMPHGKSTAREIGEDADDSVRVDAVDAARGRLKRANRADDLAGDEVDAARADVDRLVPPGQYEEMYPGDEWRS